MTERQPHAECLLPQRTGGALHGFHHVLNPGFVSGMASELPLVFSGPRTPCCTPLNLLRHYPSPLIPMLIAVFYYNVSATIARCLFASNAIFTSRAHLHCLRTISRKTYPFSGIMSTSAAQLDVMPFLLLIEHFFFDQILVNDTFREFSALSLRCTCPSRPVVQQRKTPMTLNKPWNRVGRRAILGKQIADR